MNKFLKPLLWLLPAMLFTATGWAQEAVNPKPVYLLDAGNTATDGWTTIDKNGSYPAFLQADTTYGELYATTTSGGNFFNTYPAPSVGFSEGTYEGLDGTTYSSVFEEMAATLGLESIPESVYSDNLQNGGANGHKLTVHGLDPEKCYVMYYIGGATKDSQTVAGFTLEASGYSGNPVLDYVCTSGSANHATSTVTAYANVLPVTTALRAASNGYLLVRVSYVKPTAEGCLEFKLSGERANICALAIAEIDPQEDVSAEVAESVNFSNVEWSPSNAKPNANVTLNVSGEATLTMDKTFLVNALTVQGAGPLTIAKTESNKLTATTTTISTDTTVEAGAATLGAVTIDADKTLTVKEGVALASLSGSGTLNLDVGGSTTLGNYALNSFSGVTKVSSGTLKYTASANRPAGEIIVSGASAALQIADNTDILGWDSGLPGITIENDGRFEAFNRDTFSRVLTLNTGRLVFNADDQNSGRSFDLYNNSKIVSSGTSTIGGANATNDAESNDPIVASGIIAIRRSDLEIEVTDGTLSVYSAIGTAAGNGGSVYKKGAGTLAIYRAATSALPVVVDAGELRLVRKGSLTTGAMTVNANATLAYVGTQTPTNAITNNGTIAADGEGTVADLTGATLSGSGSYDVKNGATLILKKAQADAGTVTVAAEATLKVKVDSYDTVTLDTVELAEGKNVVFVLPSGDEVIGTGATMPEQSVYTYTATAGEENNWSTVANWKLNGVAVDAVPSGTVTTPVEVVLTGATTLTMDVAGVTLSALSVLGGDLTIAGENALTVNTVATANKVVVSGALTLDAPGTEVAPTKMTNVFEVTEGGTLTTKGYLNLPALNQLHAGTLTVSGGKTLWKNEGGSWSAGLTGTVTVESGAILALSGSDIVNWSGGDSAPLTINVKGELALGTTRLGLNKKTLNLYAGATVTGEGDGQGALDYFGNGSVSEINVLADGENTADVTVAAKIRTREGALPTFTVDEGMTAVVSGVILGGSKIVADGTGTLKLTGTNTYTGGTTINEGATIEIVNIDNLATSGAVVVNGRLRIAPNGDTNQSGTAAYGTAEAPRLTGTGVLEFAGAGYYAIPAGFTTPLAVENNRAGGIVVTGAPGITIGTLSGSGYFRADWGDNGEGTRVITVKQSAASTFSGTVQAGNTGTRTMSILVTTADGVEEDTDTTLTLSGNNTTAGTTLSIAEGATVKVAGEGSWAQSVVGAGTIIFEGKLPTGSGYTDEANWQGTVKLQNYTGSSGQGATELNLDAYGSPASVVELANVTGWVGNGTVVPKLCLSEDGLTFNNGSTTSTATITVNALSGSGAIKGAVGKNWKYHVVVEDSTDFEGTIDLSETTSQCVSVVFGEGDAADGKIVIAQGTTIPAGKTWKAVNGVTVTGEGTLSGSGSIASTLTYSSTAASSFGGSITGDLTVASGTLELTAFQYDESAGRTIGNLAVDGGTLRINAPSDLSNGQRFVEDRKSITVAANAILELNAGYAYLSATGDGLTKVTGNFVLGVTGDSGLNNVTTHLEVVDGATLSLRNWRADDYALTPASLKLNGTMGLNQSGNSKNTYVVNTRAISGKGSLASGVTLALQENATIDVTDGVVTAGTVTVAGAVTVTGSVADGDYILKCTNATAEDAAKITVEGFAVTADATGYKAVAGGAVVDASLEATFTEADQTLTWSELVGENAEKLYQGGTLTITFTAEGQTFTFDKDAALAFSQITIKGEYAGTLAKTGSAAVSATATAINTDTTVEASVASLGTVTIADDKTLTVKDVNTVEAFAAESQGVYNLDLGETTADAYTIAADGKHYKVSSGTFTNAALNFSATQTNYEFAGGDLTLTGNEGQFSFGTADVTISGGTIRATHLITVQGGNDRSTTIEQTGGEIILSGTGNGSDTPMANQTIMFGHWRNASSNYTLSGGSLVAEEGGVRFGNDSSSAMTISGNGLFKVKGIKGKGSTASALTITGGKLSLGDWGFDAINSFTFSAQGGEINAFGNATINQTVALNGDVTLSADAEKTLTIYAITGTGSLTITGEGTVALPEAVVETIPVTVAVGATLKVIPTVDAAVLGKIILAEGSVVEGTLTVDGVEEFTPDGTTISFTPDATITGSAWWWDYEFNGNDNNIGSEGTALSWDGDRPYQGSEYTEAVEGDTNQMLKLPARPWRNVSIWPAEATFVMYAKAGTNADSVLASFGSSAHGSSKAITLMTGTNPENGDMRLVYTEGTAAENVVDLVENLSVPNATTSYHLYAFVLETVDEKTHVSVYVDGGLVATYTADSIIQLGGGFQIASVHGGCPSGLNRLANEDTATMDFLRVSNTVLSSEAMKALANAYPYTSPNGTATRTVESTDEVKAWIGTGEQTVWTQTTLADDGSGATTDEAQVAPTAGSVVKVTVIDETSVALNIPAEGVSYEKLELFGDGELTLTAVENAGLITIAGMTSISANATITAGAVKVGAVDVATDKILTFDYSAYDFSGIWASTTIPLTGLATGEGTVAVTFPATKPAQITTWECVKDANTQSYALKITVDSSALTGVISDDCTWDEISEWKIGEVAVSKPSDWSLVQAVTLSGTGTVTLPEGGIAPDTLKIDGTITLALPGETMATIPSLVIGAGANVTIPQTLTVTAMEIGEGATIGYAATTSGMAIAEPLTGNYNLTVVSGTVTLTGASDNAAYTGTITVKDGATLVLGYGVGLPATAAIALEDGATLFAKNGAGTSSTIASAITIDGDVTIKGSEYEENTRFTGAISGTGTLTIASGDYDNKFAIDGAITGALKVVVSIGYDVTFTSNENAFTGGLEIVEGGKLTVTQPGAMGTKGVVNNGALTFAFPAEGEGGSYTDAFSGTGDYTLASGSLTWIFGADVAVNALTVSGGKMTIVPTANNTSLNVNDAITIANGTLVIAPTATDGYNGVALATDVSVTIGNGGALAFSGETARLFVHDGVPIGTSAITVEQGGTIYAGVNGITFPMTLANGAILDLYGYGVDVDGDFLTTMTLQLTKALTLPTGENETVTVKLPTASSFLTYTGEAIEDWALRFVFTKSDGTPQTLEGVYLVDGGMNNVHNFTFASVVEIEGMSDAVAADIAQLVATLTAGEQLEVTEVVNADAAVCFEDIAYDYTLQEEVLQSGKVTLTYGFGVGDITVVQRTVDETTSNWIAVAVKVTDGGMGYGAEYASPAALRSGTKIQLSKNDGVSYEEKTALTPEELTAAGLVNGEGVYWYWAETLPEIATGKTSTTVKYKVRAVNDGTAPAQE